MYRAATSRRERLLKLTLAAVSVIAVTACGGSAAEEGPKTLGPAETSETGGPIVDPGGTEVHAVGFTYSQPSGNRYLPGKGELPATPIRIDVSGVIDSPVWLNAAVHPDGGVVWVVTGNDGNSVGYRVWSDGDSVELPVDSSSGDFSLVPPVLIVGTNGQIRLTTTRAVDGLTTLLPDAQVEFSEGELGTGELRIDRGDSTTSISLQNAPDATFMISDDSTLYSYADSTDRYPHGAIGDPIEWGGMWAVPTVDGAEATHPLLEETDVFEGLYPMLADIDQDGEQEIIGTVSNPTTGAMLVVMKRVGTIVEVVAVSEPTGTGFRWTHQVAVAPFGPDDAMELATIKTPHIGGVAEFYRLAEGKLELVASLPGNYSSHVNGSRNLDMASAGDFDGDGNVELLCHRVTDNRWRPCAGARMGLRRCGNSR